MTVRSSLLLSFALPLVLAGTDSAWATASLTCSASDRNLTFELLGNIGSGDGAAVQITQGEIKLKEARGKYPAAAFQVEPGHVAGNWSFGNELRIGLSPNKVGETSIYLTIIGERTKRGGADLDRYRGHYVLKVDGPKGQTELKGKLKDCDAG